MGNKIKNLGIGISLAGMLCFLGAARQCYSKTQRIAREAGFSNTYELLIEENRLFEKIKEMEEENILSKMRIGKYTMYGNANKMELYDGLKEKHFDIYSRLIDSKRLEEKGGVSLIGMNSFSTLLLIIYGNRRKNYGQ